MLACLNSHNAPANVVESNASLCWHPLTPVTMNTAAPPFSTFPTSIMMDRKCYGRNVWRVVAPTCPSAVCPFHFPAALDLLVTTAQPFNFSLTERAFIPDRKNDLDVERGRGFSGLSHQGGKLLQPRRCRSAARSQIKVCGLILRCSSRDTDTSSRGLKRL